MSIITLEKIVEQMYDVCRIFDVDCYTIKDRQANVSCLPDIGCLLSSQRIMFVRYLM